MPGTLNIPPLPAFDKSLPPSPMAAHNHERRSSSSDVSRVIHDVQEEADEFDEQRSQPTPNQGAARERQDTVVTPTQASFGGAPLTPTQTAAASHDLPSRKKSASDLRAEAGNRLRSMMRSSSHVSLSEGDGGENRGGEGMGMGRLASKRSLSKLSARMGSSNNLHAGFPSSSSTTRLTVPTSESAVNAGTQWASDRNGGGDGNTIAQLYAVFGLPKDPSVWTLAEEDCVAGVHHAESAVGRFWRPEVLGCSICPSPAEVLSKKGAGAEMALEKESGASKWAGRDSGGKKPNNPKFIEMSDGRGGVEKAETARVLSKALKLSFTREIEIIVEQGNYPPSATSHTFSFSVPTISSSSDSGGGVSFDGRKAAGAVGVSVGKANAASGVGEGFGLESRAKAPGTAGGDLDDGPSLATFYGVVLTVWSAADDKRAKMIRKELTRAAKQRGGANAGSTPKSVKRSGSAGTQGANSWLDGEASHADEEDDRITSPTFNNLPANSTFFMPYAICIVSRYPLYNLLGDWNKMAWHKYSRNIEMHNQLMSTILRHPAPRLGEQFSVGSPDKDLSFHCTFPGAMEWGTGLIGSDLTMWPLFKTLSLDNILTICEVALANNGRVLFQSRHPALLGMAVETIKHLVELCGWRGVANQNCHARDVKIYLEDPGSWIIAINTELRSIIKPSKEVCLVDLDINFVNCVRPPLRSISSKQAREKKRRRLMQAIFVSNVECSPPREFIEAYPGGRFRPLSNMVTTDANSAYEQLGTPVWWNQVTVIQTFDRVLREGTKSTFLKKVLMARNSKVNNISESELAAILALRKRASTFVDARDGLENKIGRLNKRLAFLMSESEMWRAQFSKIQLLVDRLTKEANDLRSKVDKERRESKRLSSSLAQKDMEHVQLHLQLKETESAREEAQAELLKMQRAMESLETEREAMMDEIRAVISGAGGVEDVNLSLSRLDLPPSSYNPLARSDSPTGSQASMTPSQAADYILKSRAIAEARISEGRPGRAMSRGNSRTGHSSNGHVRSMSQDRGERSRKAPTSTGQSTASHMNHFPDDQMNYEIQQRTSLVTSQISKIQAQLESTLTQLEGRRSGTYERENERRRGRRGSNTSLNSRYEYRTPSSLGHGGGNGMGAESSLGHGSDDGRSEAIDYEHVESVRGGEANRGTARRRKDRGASQGETNGTAPASSSPRTAVPAATGTATSPTSASNGTSASLPTLAPKSQARQRNPTNPWKEAADASSKKAQLSSDGPPSPVTPVYNNEIMLANGNSSPDVEPASVRKGEAAVSPVTSSAE